MKGWIKQLAGSLLVLVLAAAVLGFVLVLRAQQSGLGAAMAAAHIRTVSPPDGATNVPLSGEIRADYIARPSLDPVIKLEPPVGITLGKGQWDGSAFVVPYSGLRDDSLYHVELDQDDSSNKGEHKQIKVRWSFRTGSAHAATPTATPRLSVTATPSPGPTPATTPLIWYHGPYTIAYGVDWSGKQVENIGTSNIVQSPDGLRLWQKRTAVIDANGQPAGSVAVDQQMLWADDSQQFCGITANPTLAYDLELLTLDGNRHRVGAIALASGYSQTLTPTLVACSTLTGRAIVAGQQGGYIWSMAMISLVDGSVIYQQRYPNPVVRMVASHDGRYIAEQLAGSGPSTLIRELPSGNQVGRLVDVAVQGFSWDGSLVGVSTAATNATATQALIIRWQTHQTIWSQCTCPSPDIVSVLAQPGGTKLAIIASWNQWLNWSFTIVDANGTAQSVPLGNTPATPAF